MVDNKYVALTEYVSKYFVDEGMEKNEIKDDWAIRVTLFRKPNNNYSYFVLLRVVNDFRDPEWCVELSVGEGFPEKAEDPVEFYLSTISLSDLGVLNKRTVEYLPLEISEEDLKKILGDGISYCIDFIDGRNKNAIAERNKRNRNQLEDPLSLCSETTKRLNKDDPNKYEDLKSSLSSRNDELRNLLKKYL